MLYKEYLDAKSEWEREKDHLVREKNELVALREQDDIRNQGFKVGPGFQFLAQKCSLSMTRFYFEAQRWAQAGLVCCIILSVMFWASKVNPSQV